MTTARVWQCFLALATKAKTLYFDPCAPCGTRVYLCVEMSTNVCLCDSIFVVDELFFVISGRCFWFPSRWIRAAQSWLCSIPFQFNKHTHHTLELFRSHWSRFCMSVRTHVNKQTHAHTKCPQQRRKTENQVNTRDNKKNFNFGLTTEPP